MSVLKLASWNRSVRCSYNDVNNVYYTYYIWSHQPRAKNHQANICISQIFERNFFFFFLSLNRIKNNTFPHHIRYFINKLKQGVFCLLKPFGKNVINTLRPKFCCLQSCSIRQTTRFFSLFTKSSKLCNKLLTVLTHERQFGFDQGNENTVSNKGCLK